MVSNRFESTGKGHASRSPSQSSGTTCTLSADLMHAEAPGLPRQTPKYGILHLYTLTNPRVCHLAAATRGYAVGRPQCRIAIVSKHKSEAKATTRTQALQLEAGETLLCSPTQSASRAISNSPSSTGLASSACTPFCSCWLPSAQAHAA